MEAPTKKIFAKKSHYGFTIVELVVVITILSVLGLISFLSFSGFSESARDSKRITDVNMIAQQFNITIDTRKTIVTGETAASPNVSISGSGIVMTGYYGDLNIRLLESLGIFGNDLTLYDGFQSYKYAYYPQNGKYQILALLEDETSLADGMDIFEKAYATTGTGGYVYMKGNFTSTGWTNSLMPEPVIWANATPDGTGLRIIAGTGTIKVGDSVTSNPETPILDPCMIDVSNIGECSILL